MKPVNTMLLAVVLTTVIVGGGMYLYYNRDIVPSPANTNDMALVNNAASNNITTNQTQEVAYKTYTNSVFGFSFQYPNEYTAKDNLPKTLVNETGIQQSLEITDKTNLQKPTLTLHINPAGWGSEFADILYQMSAQQGKITIAKIESGGIETNNNDGTTYIHAYGNFGKNYYSIIFSFKEDAKDYEPVFRQILESFRYAV